MMNEWQREMLERLVAGATSCPCAGYLASLPPLRRAEMFYRPVYERLQTKMERVDRLYQETGQEWPQTVYLLYFRTLGDTKNQAAYMELARRVPLKTILRELYCPHVAESLLLGASGLLELYPDEPYVESLRRQFAHYAHKYGISPMSSRAWCLSGLRSANHPVLRLAEAAAFIERTKEQLVNQLLDCRSEEEVRDLFCVDAPEYWPTHPLPGRHHGELLNPKRLGNFKANIIGINLVAVIQFAYGSHVNDDRLRDAAVELLHHLSAETNTYIYRWRDAGLMPRNAFETQALLQLYLTHCAVGRCAECAVSRHILADLNRSGLQ